MKINIDIPDYDGNAIDVVWERKSDYKVEMNGREVIIAANDEGLVSLAKQMLYMACNNIPAGSHVHYDNFFTRNDTGKYELVIEKM